MTLTKTIQELIEQEGPLLITATMLALVAVHSGNYIGLLGLAILARHYMKRQRKEITQDDT